MSNQPRENVTPGMLNGISTRWTTIQDPAQFVMRYAVAIRKYLEALIPNVHDAEETSQDFLLRVTQQGFDKFRPEKGRFRDYLIRAVRNAALTHLRKRTKTRQCEELENLPAPAAETLAKKWVSEWRDCLLQRVWRVLETHQRRSPGNLFHTVLRVTVDYHDEDTVSQAARTSALVGRKVEPSAFRKQVSRARRMFAETLVKEVAETLENPSPQDVEEEMHELGLYQIVRDFLPPDWNTRLPG